MGSGLTKIIFHYVTLPVAAVLRKTKSRTVILNMSIQSALTHEQNKQEINRHKIYTLLKVMCCNARAQVLSERKQLMEAYRYGKETWANG